MNLYKYFNLIKKDERSNERFLLSKATKTTNSAVGHWISGIRKPSPQNALIIERFTSKKVTRHDLRPDVYPER